MSAALRKLCLATAVLALSGCAIGPKYHRADIATPAAYKENDGWRPARPAEVASDAPWWSIYGDPTLDGLERAVEVSNQNLKAAEASYRAARAEVGITRGGLAPQIDLRASAERSKRGSTLGTSTQTTAGGGSTGGSGSSYSLVASGSWDIDVWGRVRQAVNANVAEAQASAADVAAAKLSAQTTLAENYFQLRAAEAQAALLDQAVKDFTAALQIAKNRRAAGIITETDVSLAQTQLDNAVGQQVTTSLTRAKLEHAVAMLTGKTPAELSIAATNVMPTDVPVVPAGMPSLLLERRPDVAAAERHVAAANARIGAAQAAWFPDITLTGTGGFAASALGALFSASSSTWAYGLAAVETIFNGGTREAQISQARANFDLAVAQYRQAALIAFQQVEDQLASLRILEQRATLAAQTVADARRSEELALNQYKAGTADYTTVVTAETTRLNAEVGALDILTQRLTASVALISVLGGGWEARELPEPGTFYHLPKTADAEMKAGLK